MRTASVIGVEVAKPNEGRYIKCIYASYSTRWSLKAILAGNGAGPSGITTLTVASYKVAIDVLAEVRSRG